MRASVCSGPSCERIRMMGPRTIDPVLRTSATQPCGLGCQTRNTPPGTRPPPYFDRLQKVTLCKSDASEGGPRRTSALKPR